VFPEALEVGMQFEGVPGEPEEDAIYTVTDIAEEQVVLDGNHPLSGIAITFKCRVVGVRKATLDEIERGQPDDPDAAPVRVLH